MYYGQLSNLNWLWWVAFLAFAITITLLRHQRARKSFASPNLLRRMVPSNGWGSWMSLVISMVALVAIVIGLVDIRWGRVWREVPQRGIEVMFVLDVSRSMLAQDTSPNRLERSKQYIKDMIHEMPGDRVGLILFAGDVKQQIPLTNHYEDYIASLDEIGPHNIDRGGSNLGHAIEVAADAFLEKTSEHRAIVLFTDGEYHESQPIDAAKQALADHGTRIFTVGIGDSDGGARIPSQQRGRAETYLKHEGQTVLSKRNDGVLEQIALTTDGAYIPAGTKQVDMGAVYHRFIANIEQQDFDSARVNSYVPRYGWFLGFALLMLVLEILLSTKGRRHQSHEGDDESKALESPSRVQRRPLTATGALILLLVATLAIEGGAQEPLSDATKEASFPPPELLVQQGQAALKKGDAVTAIECFNAAEAQGFADSRMSYNKGIAHYNEGDVAAARAAFAVAAESMDRAVAGPARFNLGNTFYAAALQLIEQDAAAAIASLQNAIDHYRGALASNPDDQDARVNIELADRLRRQLAQKQEQQPQQQQQNEKQEESEGEQEEQGGEENNEENSEENKKDRNEESDQDSDSGDKQNQDRESSQDQESNQNESNSNNVPSQEQEPSDGKQENAESDAEQQSTDDADSEPPPEGELEAINDSQETATPQGDGEEGPPMTMQEARKLLQAVRDREFRNRIEQLRRMRPRRVAVEKDW